MNPGTHRERTGLLVIRVWLEEGSPAPLRARIQATHNISSGVHAVAVWATAESVLETVRKWLEEFLEAR